MRRGRAGIGLVEALIGLALSVGILASLARVMNATLELASSTFAQGRIQESSSRALTALVRELRWADPEALLVTVENGAARIDYVVAVDVVGDAVVWSTPIVVRCEPSGGDANGNGIADEVQLVRIQGGRTRTLCRNVTAGGFVVTQAAGRLDLELTAFGVTRNRRVLDGTSTAAVALLNPNGP